MAAVIRVEGADQLARSLGLAARDLDDMKVAHKLIADLVLAVARALAPRGKTGRLVRSGRARGNKGSGVIRFGAPYAAVQEFGWPARNIRPQPYGYRAVDEVADEREEIIRDRVEHTLSKVKGA